MPPTSDLENISAEEILSSFNSTCSNILDLISPFKDRRPKPVTEPWLNDYTRSLRRTCRRAERKWKRDKLYVSLGILRESWAKYQKAVKSAKTQFISNLVSKNSHRPQVIFATLKNLINPCDSPAVVPSLPLCEEFLAFFIDKISGIKSSPPLSTVDPAASPVCPTAFEQFYPLSLSELSQVVTKLRPSQYPLDSIPSRLLKDVSNPYILTLINTCLSSGCVPSVFKHAIVQPIIKKTQPRPLCSLQL